jgi:acyl carrier protein
MRESTIEHDIDTMRDWLVERVAEHVNLPLQEIQPHVPLIDYGLDSLYALSIAAEIEDHFGFDVDPTMLWDNPTIDALVEAIAKELGNSA